MGETITGVVEKINTTFSPTGAPRKWTKKSFLVNGEWFGGFLDKNNVGSMEKVQEGNSVKLTFEVKGNFKNLLDIAVVAEAPPTVVAVALPAPASTSQPYNVQEKDMRMAYNGALKSAVPFIETALRMDLISLPVKKADKLDAFYEYVKEYATKFVRDSYNVKLEEEVYNDMLFAKEATANE